jgi:hypothetical protein
MEKNRHPFPPDKSGGSDRLKPVLQQSPLCHPNPRQTVILSAN